MERLANTRSPLNSSLLGRYGLVARVAVLFVVMLGAFLLAIPVAFYTAGKMGVVSCAVAAVVCYIAGKAALLAGHAFRPPHLALYGMLIGMSLRMFLPLASVLLVIVYPPFLDAGMIYYLIVFYMIMLFVDVVLQLPSTVASTPLQGSLR